MSSRMEAPEGKPWMRWQDWVALILGVYTLLATLWTWTSGNALTAMVVLGALLVIAGAWSLSMPSSMTSEYAHILLGVLLFIAPWVLGYSGLMGAAWTSWVVGVLAVIVGAAALPEARSTIGQH